MSKKPTKADILKQLDYAERQAAVLLIVAIVMTFAFAGALYAAL